MRKSLIGFYSSRIRIKRRVAQIEALKQQFRIARNDQPKISRDADVILTRDPVELHPVEGWEFDFRAQRLKLALL